MLLSAQNDKISSPQRGKNRQQSNYDPGPLWEHLAYGCGAALVAVGPVWAGMDAMTWMAVYMGINAGTLIFCFLLGAWKDLRGPTQASRRIR